MIPPADMATYMGVLSWAIPAAVFLFVMEWGDAKQAGPLRTVFEPAEPRETARDVLRDIAVWLMAPDLDPETLAIFRERVNAVLGPDRRYVDHIDGNPLNNDPANLRFVEASENRGNR